MVITWMQFAVSFGLGALIASAFWSNGTREAQMLKVRCEKLIGNYRGLLNRHHNTHNSLSQKNLRLRRLLDKTKAERDLKVSQLLVRIADFEDIAKTAAFMENVELMFRLSQPDAMAVIFENENGQGAYWIVRNIKIEAGRHVWMADVYLGAPGGEDLTIRSPRMFAKEEIAGCIPLPEHLKPPHCTSVAMMLDYAIRQLHIPKGN